MITESDDDREIILHVEGPKGWTQTLDADTVDVLVRMGLIEHYKTTSHYAWEVRFYRKA